MPNIISDRSYSKRWKLSQSCCGCSLRRGIFGQGAALLVLLFQWVMPLISYFPESDLAIITMASISIILTLAFMIFIFISVCKVHSPLIWVSVYLWIVKIVWQIIIIITYFTLSMEILEEARFHLQLSLTLLQLCILMLDIYFLLLLRSYAYEVDKEEEVLDSAEEPNVI